MPPRSQRPFLLSLAALSAGLAAQSVVTRHMEVVLSSAMAMPPSLGPSTAFPAGAVMSRGALGTAGTQPVIDGDGAMVFVARAATNAALGISGTNSLALLRGRSNGDLAVVLRQNDSLSGLPATTRVNGATPFRATLTSSFGGHQLVFVTLSDLVVPANTPTTADTALLLGQPNALQVLMREGDVVPAVGGGAVYGEIDPVGASVASSGRAVFRNRMQVGIGGVTNADDGIILVGSVGNLTTMLREGSPWNGIGAVGEIVAVTPGVEVPARVLMQSDDGRILHDLRFAVPSGSATSTANDTALAVWSGGVDRILVREGDVAPGMPAGVVFADPGVSTFPTVPPGALDKSGAALFATTFPVGPGGLTAADNQAVFLHNGTTLSLVVREGAAAPFGAGVTFGTMSITSLQRNDAGKIAFATALAGTATAANDSAVIAGTPGALTAIAREGDAVPGYPGFVFGDLTLANVSLTERGHLLLNLAITNGTSRNVVFQHTAEHGLLPFFDPIDAVTSPAGTSTLPTLFAGTLGSMGDGCNTLMNNQGDVGFMAACQGTEATTIGCSYLRCHVGSFFARPASLPATGGVPQQFAIECGPANGGRFYFVLASSLGTRPGFPSPLGPQLVPLNFDPTWTNLSIQFANSTVWSGTFGFTDAAGNGVGPAAFTLPAGATGLAGMRFHHAVVLFNTSLVSTFVTEPAGLLLR